MREITCTGPTIEHVIHRFAGFVWDEREALARQIVPDDREIRRIASAVREAITLGGPSSGYCAVVCVPLAEYLTKRGKLASAVHGVVGEWNHSWVALFDGRILDPTADQFNKLGYGPKMPQIYLGKLPAHYLAPNV